MVIKIIHNAQIIREYKVLSATSSVSELPILKTNGKYIIRTDTGSRVILKGVTSEFFRNPSPKRDDDLFYKDLSMINEFGGNVVGFNLAMDIDKTNLDFLEHTVDFLNDRRMYVILMPVVNPPDASYPSIGPPLQELLTNLAERFGDNPSVIYGLGAEPYGPSSEAWGKREIELAAIIRNIAPQSLILLSGTNFGRDFSYLTSPKFHIDNAIIYITDYPLASPNVNSQMPEEKVMDYSAITSTYPMFVGEFGGVYKDGFGSETDISYIQRQISQANVRDLGYTMYRLEPMVEEYEGLAIQNKDGYLTKRGELMREDLLAFPPTTL